MALWGLPPFLQLLPIGRQLSLMQLDPMLFCPCLHQASLPSRQRTRDQFDGSNAEDPDFVLTVRVEVGT